MSRYIPVIGLEVHCELKSNSKNFSSSKNSEDFPNTNLSVVDIGYPGILPVVNKEAVRKSVMVALALNCKIPEYLTFDRKNYYYPDLPKGYQITQFNNPIGIKGYVMINVDGVEKKITIQDTHLEEDTNLPTRVEMKNINSFATVKEALEVEIKRQTEILEAGGVIEQETRRYDEVNKTTVFMRGKVDAIDYKYYTEPNIPPIKLREEYINSIRKDMPVLEYERKKKYIDEYGIGNVDAGTLTKDRKLSDYYESIISNGSNPKDTANIVVGFLLGYLNKNFKTIDDINIDTKDFSEVIKMMSEGKISNKQVKDIFTKTLDEDKDLLEVAKSFGTQISDKEEIRKIVNEVFNENTNIINDYKQGKNVTGFIMGLIMKKTSGKVNPGITNLVLREELDKL